MYVFTLFCSAYIYKQTFIIPGSALLASIYSVYWITLSMSNYMIRNTRFFISSSCLYGFSDLICFISLKVFFPACVWSFILFIPMYIHDCMLSLATCLHGICLHVPSHLSLCVVVSSIMIIHVSGSLSVLCNSAHLWVFLKGFFFSHPFFCSFVTLMYMT